MKKVLIFTYDMIPFCPRWGGCQRMYFLAELLINSGYLVEVYHKSGKEYGTFNHIIHFNQYPLPQSSEKISTESVQSIAQKSFLTFPNFLKKILKKIFNSFEKLLFNEPLLFDGYFGFLFYLKSRNIILSKIKVESIKVIIISGPPFTLFHLGPFIKSKLPETKIILDYRDPWNINNSSLIAEYIEGKILSDADFVVITHSPMKPDMCSNFNINPDKCEIVLNGYSEQDWMEFEKKYNVNKEIKKNSKLTISYVGGINFEYGGYRDLAKFFQALEDFIHKDEIIIRFVGATPSSYTIEFKKRYPKLLEVIPSVSTQESYKYMVESDVLLILHTRLSDSKYILPAKMFDYIRSSNPIFGIGPDENASLIKFIKNQRLGITCNNRSDEILIVLNYLYEKWSEYKLDEIRSKDNDITKYSREYQNKKFLEILKKFD
jgi:hypothetical protein